MLSITLNVNEENRVALRALAIEFTETATKIIASPTNMEQFFQVLDLD